MTRIKAYNTSTGHVETVKDFDWPDYRHDAERQAADDFLRDLVAQDHSTDTAYYVDEVK